MAPSPARPFRSVLAANRGEIAVRIVRAAKHLGLRAVAVYSDADRDSMAVREADSAVRIGPAIPAQSYLNIDAVIEAALTAKAEAIHPGYGFLSENAAFAEAVIGAGLVWIGPSPDAIRAMGDKGEAKRIARAAGVPLIPGYEGADQSLDGLLAEAERIGWPVLIKAAMGGGGRGQRRVASAEAFADALNSARREAESAFGDGRVILERALSGVRHVEVQVFGDVHGNLVHLGERDCSVQRRNQKIIEEAPSPAVAPALRSRMGDAALRLARAANYTNAGTVEFLLDPQGGFYFLEMNTRIQVEHPVTEAITGFDLIRMQFDVAMGKRLDITQEQVAFDGHAIEARLCAEDPLDGYRPQTGTIVWTRQTADVRFDEALAGHDVITPFYDSMLGKVIAHGATREEAQTRLIQALQQIQVLGVRTNRAHLIALLESEAFRAGTHDIAWLDARSEPHPDPLASPEAVAAALILAHGAGAGWSTSGHRVTPVWLQNRKVTRRFAVTNGVCEGLSLASCHIDAEYGLVSARLARGDEVFLIEGALVPGGLHLQGPSGDDLFEDVTYSPAVPKGAGSDGRLRAPMDGRVVAVRAAAGDPVTKGQVLVILEAMKMEHEIAAPFDGRIESIAIAAGAQTAAKAVLVTLTPA
ncbi:MAG: biotin/lipoyl-binding protein [Alphaproteobacteria bacterium]|nr:biotin/lipoyl-binding protein [Alphaproteobacteria bacterium]